MKKIALFILIVSQFNVYADEWNLDINKVIEMSARTKISCNPEDAATNSQSFHKCIKAICNNPDENITTYDKYISQSTKAPVSESDFRKSLLKQIKDDHQKNDIEQSKLRLMINFPRVSELIKNLENISESKFFNLLGPMIASRVLSEVLRYDEDLKRYVIDEDVVKTFTAYEQEIFGHISEKLVRSINTRDSYEELLKDSPLDLLRTLFVGGESTSDTLRGFFDNYSKLHKSVGDIFPSVNLPASLRLTDQERYIKGLKSNELDILDIQELIGGYFRLKSWDVYADLVRDKVLTRQGIVKDLKNKSSSIDNDEFILKVVSRINELHKAEDIGEVEIKKEDIEKCMTHIDRHENFLPTQKDVSQFTKKVEMYKNDFISRLAGLKGISSDTYHELSKRLKLIEFKLPLSRELWKDQLQRKINDLRIETDLRYKSLDRNAYTEFVILNELFSEVNGMTPDTQSHTWSDIQITCDEMEQSAFNDSTYTYYGKIILSHTLVNAPEFYKEGVIFHELAHNLEKLLNDLETSEKVSLISLDRFRKNKACLAKVQESIGVAEPDGFYREDFADYIAIKLSTIKTSPPDCEYISYNQKNKTFTDDSLKNKNSKDTHSSTLLRIIRGQIDLGKQLPVSCVKSIKSRGVSVIPDSCSY